MKVQIFQTIPPIRKNILALLILLFSACILTPINGKYRVAIMNFRNDGAPQFNYLQNGIGSMLGTTMGISNQLLISERGQLNQILEEMKLGMAGLVDPTTAAQVGKIAGVEYVVIGSYINLGHAIRLDAKVVNAETAIVLPGATAWAKADIVENLDVAVNELAVKLLGNFTGEELRGIGQGDSDKNGFFEFTFLDDGDYILSIGDKRLRSWQQTRGNVKLADGRYTIKLQKVKGLFRHQTLYETQINIAGGYLIRATFRKGKFYIFETLLLKVLEQRRRIDRRQQQLLAEIPAARLIISSNSGMCNISIDDRERAVMPLPNVDGKARCTIEDLASGTYNIRVSGETIWYEGLLSVNAGEEIYISTDPGQFRILQRERL